MARPSRTIGAEPAAALALAQTSVEVLPTRTIYTFAGQGVKLNLTSRRQHCRMTLICSPVR